MSGGNLRRTMTSLTHKNLPLSMFLEFSDLGISAWTGNTTGTQNNSDIINTLGVGIVWFDATLPRSESCTLRLALAAQPPELLCSLSRSSFIHTSPLLMSAELFLNLLFAV